MAARKPRKGAKPGTHNSGAAKAKQFSKQTRERLTKELSKARKRISGLMARMGAAYQGPDIKDFYLENIQALHNQGVHINTIYAMIRNTTAEKIRANTAGMRKDPIVAELYGGAPVTQTQYSRLMSAISKANRNINSMNKELQSKYGNTFDDVLPAPLTVDSVLRRVTSTKRMLETIDVINDAFKKKNLVPMALSETGEAGTMAEVQFLQSFITTENQRRAKNAERLKDIYKSQGMFKTQQEFGVTPINTNQWDSMDKWRRRTEYFTDAADLVKASRWLTNYYTSFNTLVDQARLHNIPVDSDFFTKAEQIQALLESIDTSDKVRALSQFSEYVSIQVNYITLDGELDSVITGVLNALQDFFVEYESKWESM